MATTVNTRPPIIPDSTITVGTVAENKIKTFIRSVSILCTNWSGSAFTHFNTKGLGLTPLTEMTGAFMPPLLKTNKQMKVF